MDNGAYSISAKKLAALGKQIPDELRSSRHLIYSSPATLAFNSPGAQGFGVKRAGLAVPGSVMLLVSPGCCGRNTTLLTEKKEYEGRFFFLLLDETDIVTGRHLNKIPDAVKEAAESCEVRPTCVMICITCVDALLGTDMERVCRKSSEKAGLPVLPCYMYALTREGRVPPMAAVRKTVYELLEKRKRKGTSVNLLGSFTPYDDDSELYGVLKGLGIRNVREISRCRTFGEYQEMAEANFNLVLNPESRLAADDLMKRLGIPSIELTRLYQSDRIHRQYELLGNALGAKIDDSVWMEEAEDAVSSFRDAFPEAAFAVGEWMNAEPFELSYALLRYGFRVGEIFGTVADMNLVWIRKIAELSPETRIYTNLSPTMLNYACGGDERLFTIGKDAAFYHPEGANVPWNDERQPFGFRGLKKLFERLLEAGKELRP